MSERKGSSVVEFPSELDIVLTRDFDAPITLVFDVLTRSEHMVNTIAPFGEEVKSCSVDLRVGGDYHYAFVTDDGYECSFRGTFLEVEPPTRTVETWRFDGWPDVEAVESVDLQELDGATRLTHRWSFPDKAARDHMYSTEGLEANYDHVDDYLRSLFHPEPGHSG